MARPISIKDDTILDAARRVFLRDGYKASTVTLAREAGVSEGSLFKHFKTKADLFIAAMHVESVAMDWHDRLRKATGSEDIKELLVYAADQLIERMRVIIPRMIMIRSSGVLAHSEFPCMKDVPPPLYHGKVLADYFRDETRRGRLQMRQPESQASAFFGALAHYVYCETLFNYRPAPPREYVRTVVDLIVNPALTGGQSQDDVKSERRIGGNRAKKE